MISCAVLLLLLSADVALLGRSRLGEARWREASCSAIGKAFAAAAAAEEEEDVLCSGVASCMSQRQSAYGRQQALMCNEEDQRQSSQQRGHEIYIRAMSITGIRVHHSISLFPSLVSMQRHCCVAIEYPS